MDEILTRLAGIERRLAALEQRLGLSLPQSSVPPAPSYRMGLADRPVPPPPPPPRRGDVESYIGRWLLGVIGVVAVIFGVSFFFKYAFDNNLIGETGRIILGVAGGLLLIILGEALRPKIEKYSYLLSGGGLALFYLSTYAAFWYYHKIGQVEAFGFMAAITAFGVLLSIWADAMPISVLAALGGFLTPFLLSTGIANDYGFFFYLGVLTAGILAVAFFKKWRELTLAGFAGVAFNVASWYGVYYKPEKLFFFLGWLAAFYVLYLAASTVATLRAKEDTDSADLFILTLNPVWFFGWAYYLLKPQYQYSLGFLAAGLGGLYIFLAYLGSLLRAKDRRLALFLGGLAVVFLTIAIPLELKQNAITIAWAAEAAILFILGVVLNNPGMRIVSVVVFVGVLVRLVSFDSDAGDLSAFLPFFNKRFFTYLMVTIAAFVMGSASLRAKEIFEKNERGISAFLWGAANILVLVAITMEISGFFDAKIFRLNQTAREELRRRTPVVQGQPAPWELPYQAERQVQQSAKYRSSMNQKNASISVFWTLYAVFLITLGMVWRIMFLRWSALILFGVTIGKVFLFDLAGLPTPYRIISFMVLGVILLLASYLYFRYEKRLKEEMPNRPIA